MNGFREKAWRTNARTNARTNTTPKVSNDFVERPKMSFLLFFCSGPCFIWEGVSFYIHKWFQKKLFEKFLSFGWNLIPILVKSEKSFHKSFLFEIEICPKIPFGLVGENDFCPKSYQNLFISWRFGPIWTHLASQKIEADFLRPLLIYSPGYLSN